MRRGARHTPTKDSVFILPHVLVLFGTSIARPGEQSNAYSVVNYRISNLEENSMRFTNRFIGSLVLVAALAVPAAILANAMPQASVQVRVYDTDHRDYHNWDDREDRTYRLYLTNHHRPYVEFSSQRSRDQRSYWNWRH